MFLGWAGLQPELSDRCFTTRAYESFQGSPGFRSAICAAIANAACGSGKAVQEVDDPRGFLTGFLDSAPDPEAGLRNREGPSRGCTRTCQSGFAHRPRQYRGAHTPANRGGDFADSAGTGVE